MIFSSLFVIFTPNHATIDKLEKMHNKKIEGQDFVVKFEFVCVCVCNFLFFS